MKDTQPHAVVKTRVRPANWIKSAALRQVVASAFTSQAAFATGVPSCLPPVTTPDAVVLRVADNGLLVLADRRVVKVEGLLFPAGARDNAPDTLRRESLATLRTLVMGHHVTLRARPPRLDRYRHLRAQVLMSAAAGETWLQAALLSKGLARVSIAPDRPECASEMYAAEDQARQAGAGLWASPAYAVRTPYSLRWSDLGTFQLVEGTLVSVAVHGSRGYLDFGRDWRTDFTVTIAPADMKAFRARNIDPYSYNGKRVRVRGWIDRLNGFEIEAASPAAIEVLK
jgi:hypothetical protein